MRIKRIAVAIAAALLVLTTGVLLAQGHVAGDGQTLADQPAEVQQLYESVYGDDAATQWAADHNAAIGHVAQPEEGKHPRYDEVFHVAYQRSMDMELAARITESVIARGTIEAFLAGMDHGVLYGYVPPPPTPTPTPTPKPASSSGGSSSSGSSSSSSSSSPPTTAPSGVPLCSEAPDAPVCADPT